MDKSSAYEKLLGDVKRIAGLLWMKGFAERNAGNMCIRLTPEEIAGSPCDGAPEGDMFPLGLRAPELAGECFLFSGSGRIMRNVSMTPENNLGIARIGPGGDSYQMLWGLDDGTGAKPEPPPHLLSIAARARATTGRDRAIIHTHPTSLIALSYALEMDDASLSLLLWRMHGECILVFPQGCGILDWILPGSDELGMETARVLEKRPAVVWRYHGVTAAGPDLDTVFGLIETLDKAADIYLKAAAIGPVKHMISIPELRAVAEKFNLPVDPEILGEK